MSAKRDLIIKPSFFHELAAYPQQTKPLWEKINFLVENPLPDGKLKKKLEKFKDLYRLRVGDHRVFYTFGDTWIRLLGLRKRDDQTYSNVQKLEAGSPGVLPKDGDEIDLDELMSPAPHKTFALTPTTPKSPKLPKSFGRDWLLSLQIPEKHIAPLVLCSNEDELMAAQVPASILDRVLTNLFPKPLDEVLEQPDLVVATPDDLVKFKEGTLLSFLLKLDPDQEKLTTWALKGPTLVKGGAGTGKSTIALYRVRALLRRPGATGKEQVLFTTYTKALEAVSRQLLESLLTKEELQRVRVETCDSMVMETLRKVRKLGEIESNPEKVLTTLLKTFTPTAPNGFEQKLRARSLAKYAPRYLLEEIEWLIEGRGLDTLAEYEKAPRPGRGVALGAKMRGVIWELYRSYSELLKKSQKETFASLRHEAARVATQDGFVSPFDYVLVDEAQDLAPVTLQFVAHLAKSAEGLFFAADNKQSIYSKGSGWSSADARLQFKGRTSQLSQNYRSTAQLDSAAFELLETEPGEEAPAASKSAHEGPLPVLLKLSKPQNESKWLAQFLKQMAKYLGVQTHAAAVLVPDKETGAAVALELTGKGIPARFFGSKTLDLKTAEVKVLTMHSAKGLEFPTVVVTGLKAGAYPTPEQFPEEPEVYQEALRLHRRLLYVACTRAMRGLMVVVPKDCSDEVLVPLMTSKSGRWVQQEGK